MKLKFICIALLTFFSICLFADTSLLPSSYNTDVDDLNEVPDVRNQLNTSACWAFGVCGCMEACAIKKYNTNPVFSPINIVNRTPYPNVYLYAGASHAAVFSYLSNLIGPVAEKDDPFREPFESPAVQPPALGYCENAYILSDDTYGLKEEELKNIKTAVAYYGGVTVSYYNTAKYFTDDKKSYYCPEKLNNVTHEVTIIGWDDNYSKNKFRNTPENDGAFLVKNSWGTGENLKGFFWISYYDANMHDAICYDFTKKEDVKYNRLLSHTNYCSTGTITYHKKEIYGKINYNINENATIYGIRIFNEQDNFITAEIYLNGEQENNKKCAVLKNVRFPGYRTFRLSEPVKIQKGDKVTLILKYENGNSEATLPVEMPNGEINPQFQKGYNFSSSNSKNWKELKYSIAAGLLTGN